MIRFLAFIVWLMPAAAIAQPAPAPQDVPASGSGAPSNLWLVAGTAFGTVRGDCQTCETEAPFRHSATVLANAGFRLNSRVDIGGEVFWMPFETGIQHVRATHLDAVAQFRPWASQGFFVKGGAGMAFVRNWVDAVGPDAINSKALSVVIGGGWILRPTARFGLQFFASQHAAALGDLQVATTNVPDVIANFWSIGMGVVIR